MSNIYTSSRGDSHYSEIIMMHQLCAVGFGIGVFLGGVCLHGFWDKRIHTEI